jgi:cyclophilin family peptidyl-prolyl cis-trans isomerase
MFTKARIISLAATMVVFAALAAACGDGGDTTASPTASEQMDTSSGQPSMTIDVSKTYIATFTMDGGDTFVIELFADKAPITVNSFVSLAQKGYFDGTTFHRVIPGFMSQAGDPTGTGTGGPGYTFENEFHPDARHDSPGMVSMANAGIRNGKATNGSQFFIIHAPQPHLDGVLPDGSPRSDCAQPGKSCHSVFGRVTSGLDVVINMTPRNPQTATSPGDKIESVVITVE